MRQRLPPWFTKKMPEAAAMSRMEALTRGLRLHTICESALCPNQGDCFSQGTATFLLLGNVCTRNCTFCAVAKGVPSPVDVEELEHLAEAVVRLGLNYVVMTSVTRDDLPDGGASHFAEAIAQIKHQNAAVMSEVLIPDFCGSLSSLRTVVEAQPSVTNHNVETVPRLYPEVRPRADFRRSLGLLRQAKEIDPGIVTKSGLMVGLGETVEELVWTMEQLRQVDCDLLTIGQYLQPSPHHHPVVRYVPPEEFREYEVLGTAMGFSGVASAPLVRSSFNASQLYEKTLARRQPVSGRS
ncbi:MAG: lipoyl synthase [Dehalococcoidia bacterium]|nr:lipoyl synthase [Dehalococcoidia bacterium]